jgi:hypothetical protein
LATLQLVRQMEALLAGIAAAVLLLPLLLGKEKKRSILGLAIVFTFCVIALFIQFESNSAVTGNPLLSPYTVFGRQWPNTRLFGFGPAGMGVVATFSGDVSKAFAVLMRMSAWSFGWPSSLLAAQLVAFGFLGDRRARACVALVLLHAAAYFFLVFGAVHDIGSPYHLFSLPLIAMVTAVALVELGDRLAALGTSLAALPMRLAFAASIVAAASFWPLELSRLSYVASSTREPIEAASNAAATGPILMFWDSLQPPGPFRSWVYFPPPPGPHLDDPVLWVHTSRFDKQIAASFPTRKPFRLGWDQAGHLHVEPL